MFFIDYYYLGIVLIPGILIALFAEIKLNSVYSRCREIFSSTGKTASEYAKLFLNAAGIYDVDVVRVRGELTDYYSHRKRVVALSEDVYDSTSIAAIGIACHEVGHAIQYQKKYFPITLRNLIIPVCNFANRLLWFFIIFGMIFIYSNIGTTFLLIGIIAFALSVLVNLITLPVEYNASKRAMQLLSSTNEFSQDELSETKNVLNAAALTYVAGLIISILNLLRLLLIFRRRSD